MFLPDLDKLFLRMFRKRKKGISVHPSLKGEKDGKNGKSYFINKKTSWARWAEPLLFHNPSLYYPKTYVRIYLGDAEYSPECIDMANLYFRAIRSKKKACELSRIQVIKYKKLKMV